MLTNNDTIQALTDAFGVAGIDTPEKVAAFVKIAALQVKKNTQLFEVQQLMLARTAANSTAQAAIEAKQAEAAATDAAILATIAGQA